MGVQIPDLAVVDGIPAVLVRLIGHPVAHNSGFHHGCIDFRSRKHGPDIDLKGMFFPSGCQSQGYCLGIPGRGESAHAQVHTVLNHFCRFFSCGDLAECCGAMDAIRNIDHLLFLLFA